MEPNVFDKIHDIEQIKAQILTEKQLTDALLQLDGATRARYNAQQKIIDVIENRKFKDINNKGETVISEGQQVTRFFESSNNKYTGISQIFTKEGKNILYEKNKMLSVNEQLQMVERLRSNMRTILQFDYGSAFDTADRLTKGGKLDPHKFDSKTKQKFTNKEFSAADKLLSVD